MVRPADPSSGSVQLVCPAGLHKVKWCLQEFFDFLCACDKKHPSALFHATFSVRLCCFHAFLYLLYSYLSVYFRLMYHLTLQITILGIAPDKPIMCLQENLVDCADCGGLPIKAIIVFKFDTLSPNLI